MKPISPVIIGLEPYEVHLPCQGQQPGTQPLTVLRSPDGRFMTRWTLTDEERKEIAEGADLYITLWTFNQGMDPLAVQVMRPDMDPEIVKAGLALEDDLRLRMLQEDVHRAHAALAERIELLSREQKAVVENLSKPKPEGVGADAGENKGSNDQGVDA